MVNRSRRYLALWTVLILIVVVPWLTFKNHSHWQQVAWIPFFSPEVKVRDVVANVLFYVPWGYFAARQRRHPSAPVWGIVALAAALSIATEISQVYSHGRFPSATDVVCNVVGALIGAEYARRARR